MAGTKTATVNHDRLFMRARLNGILIYLNFHASASFELTMQEKVDAKSPSDSETIFPNKREAVFMLGYLISANPTSIVLFRSDRNCDFDNIRSHEFGKAFDGSALLLDPTASAFIAERLPLLRQQFAESWKTIKAKGKDAVPILCLDGSETLADQCPYLRCAFDDFDDLPVSPHLTLDKATLTKHAQMILKEQMDQFLDACKKPAA